MQLSDHFSLAELTQSQTASRLGLDNTPPPDVIKALERTAQGLEYIRTMIRAPIIISSGYRSPFVNRKVGGAASSQHTRGEAADITAPGYGTPADLMARIVRSDLDFDQCLLEFYNRATGTGWVHVSFAAKPRRQALVIDSSGVSAYA